MLPLMLAHYCATATVYSDSSNQQQTDSGNSCSVPPQLKRIIDTRYAYEELFPQRRFEAQKASDQCVYDLDDLSDLSMCYTWRVCMFTYVRTCMHTYIRTYIHYTRHAIHTI